MAAACCNACSYVYRFDCLPRVSFRYNTCICCWLCTHFRFQLPLALILQQFRLTHCSASGAVSAQNDSFAVAPARSRSRIDKWSSSSSYRSVLHCLQVILSFACLLRLHIYRAYLITNVAHKANTRLGQRVSNCVDRQSIGPVDSWICLVIVIVIDIELELSSISRLLVCFPRVQLQLFV